VEAALAASPVVRMRLDNAPCARPRTGGGVHSVHPHDGGGACKRL